MKKILVLLSLSALLGVAFVTPSCSTSQTTTVTKAEGVVVNTVDVGMKTWHDYVVLHLTDGKVTQKEIDNVSTGYTAYYNAQLVVKAMLEKLVTTGSCVSNTTGCEGKEFPARCAIVLPKIPVDSLVWFFNAKLRT